MNRRDLLLNEMNITQWVLTKPQVLKGDAQIRLDKAVKLVVVCEENHQTSGLFLDVLRTLQLQPSQYQWLDAEQALRLSFEHQPIFWLIQAEPQALEIAKKFADQTAWQHTSWQDLTQVETKRQLWQQMAIFCQHFEDNHD
ncbi:DNA polymerase III subunit psi [Actinobacillus vicugnae]|uniref:DNA polymerase III subunit psi n=1 Tax=Actinobacillus vicugnae TaxID=2573093 RepID=UPI00123F4FBA|nr:DNA polymerase III subunit psi [Actinobacillus vicugnae]